MKLKKLAVGFGFFFVSYLVARLIDNKLGVSARVSALIGGGNS